MKLKNPKNLSIPLALALSLGFIFHTSKSYADELPKSTLAMEYIGFTDNHNLAKVKSKEEIPVIEKRIAYYKDQIEKSAGKERSDYESLLRFEEDRLESYKKEIKLARHILEPDLKYLVELYHFQGLLTEDEYNEYMNLPTLNTKFFAAKAQNIKVNAYLNGYLSQGIITKEQRDEIYNAIPPANNTTPSIDVYKENFEKFKSQYLKDEETYQNLYEIKINAQNILAEKPISDEEKDQYVSTIKATNNLDELNKITDEIKSLDDKKDDSSNNDNNLPPVVVIDPLDPADDANNEDDTPPTENQGEGGADNDKTDQPPTDPQDDDNNQAPPADENTENQPSDYNDDGPNDGANDKPQDGDTNLPDEGENQEPVDRDDNLGSNDQNNEEEKPEEAPVDDNPDLSEDSQNQPPLETDGQPKDPSEDGNKNQENPPAGDEDEDDSQTNDQTEKPSINEEKPDESKVDENQEAIENPDPSADNKDQTPDENSTDDKTEDDSQNTSQNENDSTVTNPSANENQEPNIDDKGNVRPDSNPEEPKNETITKPVEKPQNENKTPALPALKDYNYLPIFIDYPHTVKIIREDSDTIIVKKGESKLKSGTYSRRKLNDLRDRLARAIYKSRLKIKILRGNLIKYPNTYKGIKVELNELLDIYQAQQDRAYIYLVELNKILGYEENYLIY